MDTVWAHASEIAEAVANGDVSAVEVTEAALARIARRDPALNAFTAVLEVRALARAEDLDNAHTEGRS
ncbi:MAG: AtzE family amidohydrolase, partial [Xanthobacteraceae bacterium]